MKYRLLLDMIYILFIIIPKRKYYKPEYLIIKKIRNLKIVINKGVEGSY